MTRKQAGMAATPLSLIPFSVFGGGMEEEIDIKVPRVDILIATVRGRFDHPRPTNS